MKVGFVGIGKLGMPCAEVMAERYDVIGYDIADRTSEIIRIGSSLSDAVLDRDIVFVAIQTPHDPRYGGETPTHHLTSKDFDYSHVVKVLTEINAIATKDQLVVLISTVLPGTTRRLFSPIMTNARFIYNPYLIAMGSVKWDMKNPDMVIIGTEDGSETGDAKQLLDFYRPLMQNDPRMIVGTWDEAEATKIFYNSFISAKLSLVNMIQDVAERNGNMNVDVVTNALAHSYRVMGPTYMTAGMGDAGSCHPRDNIALRFMAEELDLGYDPFDAIMLSRERQAQNMAEALLKHGRNVVIVGKAYKPGVAFVDGSSSLLVGHFVQEMGGVVTYYDVNTGDLDLPETADVYLIAYWDTWTYDVPILPGATVVDPWRRYQADGIKIVHYGNTRGR
jgi:UDPglucose 6-dehydrogenase